MIWYFFFGDNAAGDTEEKERGGGENLQAKVNVLQIDTDTKKMLSFIYIKEW